MISYRCALVSCPPHLSLSASMTMTNKTTIRLQQPNLADDSFLFLCRAGRTSPAACAGRAWGGRHRTSRRWPGRLLATMARRRASRSCSPTGPSSDAAPALSASPFSSDGDCILLYYVVCLHRTCLHVVCAVMTGDLKCLLLLLRSKLMLYPLDQDSAAATCVRLKT